MMGDQKAGTLMTGNSNRTTAVQFCGTLGELLRAYEPFGRVQLSNDVLL
jgi:hypothetical protein